MQLMHLLRAGICLLATAPLLASAGSTCFGSSSHGRLEGGVQLPASGPNFSPYSVLGVSLGRTHVHAAVAQAIVEAYGALALSRPQTKFVYGETGWAKGGRLRPHRTHQNGSAADFMVPVLDANGQSVALATGPFNKFGYAIEFDAKGVYEDVRIDFDAIGAHLHALHLGAIKNGTRIGRVIIEPAYIPMLLRGKHGAFIRQSIPFMQGKAWIRHDEHYHVDFVLACQAMPVAA